MKVTGLTVILILTFNCCSAQIRDYLLNTYYKKYSPNTSHYFISKPYASQLFDTLGSTTIYNANGQKIWEVNRYFSEPLTFLDNSGNKLTLINSYAIYPEDTAIVFFDRDRQFKIYKAKDLRKRPFKYPNWLYNSYENHFYGRPHSKKNFKPDSIQLIMDRKCIYTKGNTLNIITSDKQIISLDLTSGEIIGKTKNAYKYIKRNHFQPDSLITQIEEVKFLQYGIPPLADSSDFEIALAHFLGLKHIPPHELGIINDNKKREQFELHLLVDQKGKADILKLTLTDKQLREKVLAFINTNHFSTSFLNPKIEKMYVFEIIFLEEL